MTARDRKVILNTVKMLNDAAKHLTLQLHIDIDVQEPLTHIAQAAILLRRIEQDVEIRDPAS